MKHLVIFVLLLLLVSAYPLAAQGDESSFVLLIDRDAKAVVRVTFGGATSTVPLDVPDGSFSRAHAVSDDGRFLAACYLLRDDAGVVQLVVDLTTGAHVMNNTYPDVRDCQAGAFTADNSLVAFGFINYNPVRDSNTNPNLAAWDLRVYEVSSGQELDRLDALTLPSASIVANANEPVMPVPVAFEGDVVTFYASARQTEMVNSDTAYAWNIPAGTVTRLEGRNQVNSVSAGGDRAWLDVEPALPVTQPALRLPSITRSNNVVMVANRETRSAGGGIVYYAKRAWLTGLQFVNGGRDLIAEQKRININDFGEEVGELVRIGRDGSSQMLDAYGTVRGTLDGYVLLAADSLRYVEGDTVNTLWQVPADSNLSMIYAPPMNVADDLPSFTTFAVNEIDTTVYCDGVTPSRLMVDGMGRVVGGAPVSLRYSPSIEAQIWQDMPDGGMFNVIDGPFCDDDGRAWWYVSFQGQDGWLPEMENGTYKTEPVS